MRSLYQYNLMSTKLELFSFKMDSLSFMSLFSSFVGQSFTLNNQEHLSSFKSFFGVTPIVCSIIWTHLLKSQKLQLKPIHLLWSLLFLKQYNTETVNSIICRCDKKTFRKWVWLVLNELRYLNKVCVNTGH